MIRKAATILDVEFIQHEEWIEVSQLRAANGSSDASADTFCLFLGEEDLCDFASLEWCSGLWCGSE